MSEIQLATQQFRTSLELALQQKAPKIAPLCRQSRYTGSNAVVVDQLNAVSMSEVTGRLQDLATTEATYVRRWSAPRKFELALQMDSFDAVKTFIDPKAGLVENARASLARKMDDLAVAGMWADATTGPSAGTTATWASEGSAQIVTQAVGGSAACKINLKKLREARRILMSNDIDMDNEMAYVVLNSTQYDALRDEAQIVSNEYAGNDAIAFNQTGRIERIMGFRVIQAERLVADASGYTRVPVFTANAVDFGVWDDLYLDVYQDKTKSGHPWTVYISEAFNAARIDPKRLVEIKCLAA